MRHDDTTPPPESPNGQRTDPALVGSKVVLAWSGAQLMATVVRLDITYPRTAYAVSWTRVDNPTYDEDYPTGAAAWQSIAHCSKVRSVLSGTDERLV